MPIFGDLARMFQSQGPVNWDIARQIGVYMASQGEAEPNVDPVARIRFEELARIAEMHVATKTGLDTMVAGHPMTVVPTTRSAWASATLDAYKPLFEKLATSLGQGTMTAPQFDESDLPEELKGQVPEELLGNLMSVMAPTILGMQLGLMTGHLARRSLGQYDLPVPRQPAAELLVVVANLDEFANDWSLPPDDVRLWVCLDNITHAAVLNRTHVRERVLELLESYAGGFRPDPAALTQQFEGIDPTNAESWESAFGDPRALLGSMETDEQRSIKPQLEAITVVIEGYVDYLLDSVGAGLIGSYGPLSEALRRRRVESNQGDRFVEQMFGLELTQKQYDRGERFVRGVVERAGDDGLARLWSDARHLPTPPEVDAPGLWWERVNLPDDPAG
jgi:putative hydrolase